MVEVELWGPGDIENDTAFHCKTVRRNPAKVGNVTGSATYASFLASMLSEYTIDSFLRPTFCYLSHYEICVGQVRVNERYEMLLKLRLCCVVYEYGR